MSLSADERILYARHRLLAEVGDEGQERLAGTRVDLSGGDPRAAVVARLYLDRAGVGRRPERTVAFDVPDAAEVDAVATRVSLRPAAEALVGALVAVEAIRAALGAAAPRRIAAPRLAGAT